MNISVAMATYNGEKYISEQIESILFQMKEDDELIISDDGSTDKTIEIVSRYSKDYHQVKVYMGPKQGVFKNFENAIMHCSNEIIFLSDQDDIWLNNKRKNVLQAFDKSSETAVVLHKGLKFSDNGDNCGTIASKYKKGFIRNWLKSSYWGCCMAMRKEYIAKYIPFSGAGVAHDQLIGLLGEKDETVFYLDEYLIKHRIHDANVTRKAAINKRIMFRIRLIVDFISNYYFRS